MAEDAADSEVTALEHVEAALWAAGVDQAVVMTVLDAMETYGNDVAEKARKLCGEFNGENGAKVRDCICGGLSDSARSHLSALILELIAPEARSKRCGECGVVRLIGEFQRNARAASGRMSVCKECQKVRKRRNVKRGPSWDLAWVDEVMDFEA